jgi:hypothetical protein
MLETVYKIERKSETGFDTDRMKSASGQRPKICQCKTSLKIPADL